MYHAFLKLHSLDKFSDTYIHFKNYLIKSKVASSRKFKLHDRFYNLAHLFDEFVSICVCTVHKYYRIIQNDIDVCTCIDTHTYTYIFFYRVFILNFATRIYLISFCSSSLNLTTCWHDRRTFLRYTSHVVKCTR